MATLWTRWLLSILLVNVPQCFAPGPPEAPSPPDCYIPCDEKTNCADIHCSWDPGPDPHIPTDYSLHWEPAIIGEVHVINGTSLSGIILREHFNHGDLRVWVQAKNQHGSVKSRVAVFNTANIIKLPPPKVTSSSHQDSFEIYWDSSCSEQQLSLGYCDVRYRNEADQVWLEDQDVLHGSYTVDSPQPGTVYEFQIRCSCDTVLKSDWSEIHRIRSTETAPVGELDVWRDCGISQASSACVLTWKTLPISQAHGLILGYEVRLSYNNGTLLVVNVSIADPKGWLVCEGMQCHFTSSLKDASSVSVSAHNACGATVPSYLAIPIPGEEKNRQVIHLQMNEENLTVSWDLPSQLSDDLKEYVVQYKRAGSPQGQGFDWVKVNKSQTTGLFRGHYEKYTPYQVSLFSVSHSGTVQHLSSVIGYSLQGTPSIVPSFNVFSIAATHVTLFWEPVPLSRQNGVILCYQIIVDSGKDSQKVYNVSASPQHESKTFKLHHLSPGQEYEVRVRAVTEAGPGTNETVKFKTKHPEDFAHVIPAMLGIIFVIVICILVAFYCACQGERKACPLGPVCFYDKVPDARNSYIFKHMKHQINDMTLKCIPIHEPHPKISLLEVVEIQHLAFKSSLEETSDADGLTKPVVRDGCLQVDYQDDQSEDAVTDRTDHRYRREEYSKMVDSDEERDGEKENGEDCWSSSEEEEPTSGYEKHFMPTAFEVQVA